VLNGHSAHDKIVGVCVIQYRSWPIENRSCPIETCHTSFLVRWRITMQLAPTRIRYPDGPAHSDSPYLLPQNFIQTKIFERVCQFFSPSHFINFYFILFLLSEALLSYDTMFTVFNVAESVTFFGCFEEFSCFLTFSHKCFKSIPPGFKEVVSPPNNKHGKQSRAPLSAQPLNHLRLTYIAGLDFLT